MPNLELQIKDPAIRSLVCEHCWSHFFTYSAFQSVWTMEENPGSKGYSYVTSWEAIRDSISQGCNWCKLLSGRAKKGTGKCTITVTSDTETESYTPAGIRKLHVKYQGDDGSFNSGFSYRLYTTSDDYASHVIRARDRILQINAPSSYELALKCLNHCIEFHDMCPKPVNSSTLPDRVIDCSNLERPKLIITNNVPGIYSTLSYVWGRNQNLVTTTKNIDSFVRNGMDIELFPPTIRHALISAHSLGMPYLWIDALCILQDSAEDKGRQIAQMHKIYTNAYFTIIAACANGVDEGFLQDRPARVPSAHIPFLCPNGKVGSVYLASTEMIGYDVTRMYHDEMEPVSYRGWCLQESVLSQRSLVFASDTIKYHCQTETVNIGDALCEPSTGPRLPKAFTNASAQDLSPEELMWARRSWLFMIWEYSRRNLTRPDEDKLNALAGIAEQYHHIWQTKYYAGLWEHTFLEDLLWKVGGAADGPSERSKIYRAPSWSWASIDSHTDAQNFESKLRPGAYDIGRCVVVECNITLAREDSLFAAVTAAYLKLEAFVHEATLDTGGSNKRSAKIILGSDASRRQEPNIGSVSFDCLEDPTAIGPIWVVPIIWDRGHSFVEALILAVATGGHFRRIGLLSKNGRSDWVEKGEKKVVIIV